MTDNTQAQPSNTIWIKAFTPAGFQVGVTLHFDSLDALPSAGDIDRKMQAAGYSVNVLGLEPGAEKEQIKTVIRRTQINKRDNSQTPIIDLYGDKMQFRFTSIYLNTPDEVSEFEAQSGLDVNDLPEYDSTAPLDLENPRAQKYALLVKTPFVAVKMPNGEKEINGVMQMTYKFSGYGSPKATPAPSQPATSGQRNGQSQQVITWPTQESVDTMLERCYSGLQISSTDVIRFTGIPRLSDLSMKTGWGKYPDRATAANAIKTALAAELAEADANAF